VLRIVCLGRLVAGELFDAKVVKLRMNPISRLPWDTWSSPSLPVCVNIQQLAAHEKSYYNLGSLRRQDLMKTTGCSIPCQYWEFKMVGSPVKTAPASFYGFQLGFAKSEYVEEKEVYLYDLTSFVSEFGGALFLGFSFFSCWDVLHIFLTACHQGKVYTNKTGK
jgi:hypothetical protein